MFLVSNCAEIIAECNKTCPIGIDWLVGEQLRNKRLSELNFYTVIYKVYDLYITPLAY